MRVMEAQQVRSGLCGISAGTTLGTLFAFAAVLRALEPAQMSSAFAWTRIALHGLVCFGLGTAIAWSSASRALAALTSNADDAMAGLDAAHRTAGRFAIGSFAVWMVCASLLSLIHISEPTRLLSIS